MTNFGIVSPPGNGHLNPMIALGSRLMERGHTVTVVTAIDAEDKVNNAGLGFVAIGKKEYPKGSVKEISEVLGKLSGIQALLYTIDLSKKTININLKYTPQALIDAKIEALLIDQTMLEGSTIAEASDIPFVTICNALLLTPESKIPPCLTSWDYDCSWLGILRNQLGYSVLALFSHSLKKLIEDYRCQNNLSIIENLSFDEAVNSKLAVICQQPKEFDFPRTKIFPHYHFTGLFTDFSHSREIIDFPWNKLTGKPLIYASLGTVQNKLFWIFQSIADACADLDVQLVISLGGSTEPENLGKLSGSPIVVKYAPQLEILEKTALCITHAGMNTTLESLFFGVPMLAIPIANDQPGIAARIKWTQTGKTIQLQELMCGLLSFRLKKLIVEILRDSSYKQNALRFRQIMRESGGGKRAVDIIEKAIFTNKPVDRK